MPKIKVKVKQFKQESAHRRTDTHTDAIKRIIYLFIYLFVDNNKQNEIKSRNY